MLAIPHYGLNYAIDNWSGATPVGPTPGTSFTLGNSDAKGSTTDVFGTTLAADCYMVRVAIGNTNASGVDTSALVDIMYDPAGGTAWSVLIPNLMAGFALNFAGNLPYSHSYTFPLFVPKGSTVGVRGQTTRTSGTNNARVIVEMRGGPSRPGFWYGTRVTDVGTVTASSAGLDHTVGSTGAYSSWANIGGTSAPAFGFVTMGVQGSSATHNSPTGGCHFRFGMGSVVIPGALFRSGGINTVETMLGNLPEFRGCYCSVPAGTQLQVSGTAGDATTETFSIALYGVS